MDIVVKAASDPWAIASTVVSSITSPWWMPSLMDAHEQAAEWLPILGCVLAILQIAAVIVRWVKPPSHHDD